jgi:flagellar biosynthesis protein FlhG
MSGHQDQKTPKTLADVSHLFFSKGEDGERPSDGPVRPGPTIEPIEVEQPIELSEPRGGEEKHWSRTLVVPVTGNGRPGVSTVAVNLAHALLPWGRVGLFDADPRLPNARFYLGLPSSDYLGHATGGSASPTTLIDGGLVVGDWVTEGAGPDGPAGAQTLYVDVDGAGRRSLDIVVVDVALGRLGLLASLIPLIEAPVLVAGPDLDGFVEAYAGVASLRSAGMPAPLLVVNGVDSHDDAARFAAKMREVSERLLGVKVGFAGAVRRVPGLGSRQRERGPIVRSEPDSIAALSLREVASNVLAAARGGVSEGGADERDAAREVQL